MVARRRMHSIPRSLWEGKPLLTAALVTSQTHPGAFTDGLNIFSPIIVDELFESCVRWSTPVGRLGRLSVP